MFWSLEVQSNNKTVMLQTGYWVCDGSEVLECASGLRTGEFWEAILTHHDLILHSSHDTQPNQTLKVREMLISPEQQFQFGINDHVNTSVIQVKTFQIFQKVATILY